MRNIFLSTDGVETLFGLVAVVIWIAVNYVNARKKQGRRPTPPPTRPATPFPTSAERSPEDELREFLETLTGNKTVPEEAPPPPPPVPTQVPPAAPTVERPIRSAIKTAGSTHQRRRTKIIPTAEATPLSSVSVRELAGTVAEPGMVKRAHRVGSSFRLPSVALPGVRMMMPMQASAADSGMRAYGASHLNLNQQRELRRAIRMQAILSTPAGLR